MKIRFGSVVVLLTLTMFLFSTSVFAGGGKVRGDKGKGTVSNGSSAQGSAKLLRAGR